MTVPPLMRSPLKNDIVIRKDDRVGRNTNPFCLWNDMQSAYATASASVMMGTLSCAKRSLQPKILRALKTLWVHCTTYSLTCLNRIGGGFSSTAQCFAFDASIWHSSSPSRDCLDCSSDKVIGQSVRDCREVSGLVLPMMIFSDKLSKRHFHASQLHIWVDAVVVHDEVPSLHTIIFFSRTNIVHYP